MRGLAQRFQSFSLSTRIAGALVLCGLLLPGCLPGCFVHRFSPRQFDLPLGSGVTLDSALLQFQFPDDSTTVELPDVDIPEIDFSSIPRILLFRWRRAITPENIAIKGITVDVSQNNDITWIDSLTLEKSVNSGAFTTLGSLRPQNQVQSTYQMENISDENLLDLLQARNLQFRVTLNKQPGVNLPPGQSVLSFTVTLEVVWDWWR